MTRPAIVACVLWLAVSSDTRVAAQDERAEVQSAAGVHTIVFRTAAGVIRVQVAADAAPGDTLSGVALTEPIGSSPEERTEHRAELNAMVLSNGDSDTPIGQGQYRWSVPAGIRTGRLAVTLRSAERRTLAQATVPIDGVPAPAVAAASFELPTVAQAGQPAIIRGAFAGRVDQITVRVGAAATQVLAASPRRIAFAVPGGEVGRIPLSLTADGRNVQGALRVLSVRLGVSSTQLARGQTGTLTGTVTGLRGIDAAVALALRNFSEDVVRVQDGESQVITVTASDLTPAGTYTLTRVLTGVRPGAFRITLLANTPPLTTFDPAAAGDSILTSWEAATGVRISAATRGVIERSVLESGALLQQFLAQQQQNRADVRDVFAALLSHYCFDLRDTQQQPRRTATAARPSPLRLIALAQPRAAQREITADDVQRYSFREFLNTLLARFSGAQPVGYLFISSVPASGGITIDGQRKSEMTNRRFVTSTGEHAIVIAGPSRTCRQRVQVAAYQTAVVTCAS